jgi:Fe-S cluster assembly protein SufD
MSITAQNLPSPEEEAWKYTNLPAAIRKLGPAAGAAGALRWDGPRDIDVPGNTKPVQPFVINIEAPGEGAAIAPFSISLGENAQATVIERHSGGGRFWSNMTTRVTLAPGARLYHYRLQDYAAETVFTHVAEVTIARDATYDSFTLTTGAGLSRNEIHARLEGPGGHCELNGVNLLRGQQHGDTTIIVDHQAPYCTSHQFYRSVLNDRARGVFQGKIHVAREAQKTDGFQMSKALVLSEGAEMDIKPELEIYADDVKCSHGATMGQIDEDALFYLRSRGIPYEEARGLLISSFVGEAIDKITDEMVRREFLDRVELWLAR